MSDTPRNLPELRMSPDGGSNSAHGPDTPGMPDSVQAPALYQSITFKRSLAWVIDAIILLILLSILWVIAFFGGIVTFGLLWKVAAIISAILPAAYHAYLVGGPASATIGMSVTGLTVRTIDGGSPNALQGLVMVVGFYMSLTLLTPLVLGVAFFNSRRRCLHDMLSGVVVVNRRA